MEAEMTLRPMTAAEQPYCYSQPLSILNRVGCIGYLRGDLGVENGLLLSTWQTYREDLKSDAFKPEFDSILDALRNDPRYGGILKNLNTMEKYCDAHADSALKSPDNYGFRVETEHYTCFLRLEPDNLESQLTCYCYLKQWLEAHMNYAKNGIRFITPDYKTLFWIPDAFPDGEAPELPWIVYRQTYANRLLADNRVYYNSPVFVIELYTEFKSPETEAALESALASAELIWTKDEDYLDSERCYMITYTVTF